MRQTELVWSFLRKDDSQCVKKCTDFVVEVVRPKGRPKRTWKEVVEGI